MRTRRLDVRVALVLLMSIILSLGLGACGRDVSAGAPLPTGTSTIPADATQCNQVPGMANAQLTYIMITEFPESAVAVASIVSKTGSPLQVVTYRVCVPLSAQDVSPKARDAAPPDAAIAVLGLERRGWQSSATFPFDAAHLSACHSDQRCFTISPTDFLLMDQATKANDALLIFHLLVAEQAPLVACDPLLFPGEVYPSTINPAYAAEIPLPPFTRASTGQGISAGVTTFLCTAGSASSITTYMQRELPKYGWEKETVSGVELWKTAKSTPELVIRIFPITDPHRWSIIEYFSGATA